MHRDRYKAVGAVEGDSSKAADIGTQDMDRIWTGYGQDMG